MKLLIKTTITLLVLTIIAGSAYAFSIRDLLGLDDEKEREKPQAEASVEAKSSNWAKSKSDKGQTATSVDLNMIKRLLANLDSSQREALLADEAAFSKFVTQEASSLSVLKAAQENNLHKDANVQFLMQRGAGNILRELYINRLMKEKIPQDFPSDAQLKEYFDNNQDKFVVPQRIHVWQIFLADNCKSSKPFGQSVV